MSLHLFSGILSYIFVVGGIEKWRNLQRTFSKLWQLDEY